jgi:wyosine [tRNA(Phe)-imidazoG37] synthetase (radical SAM superfamily)
MLSLSPSSIFTGPRPLPRWGQTLTLDLGAPDSTLAISRENRLPRSSVVITLAARELMRLSKAGDKVETVLVIGSQADPTSHPAFKEITESLRELRNKWFPKAKLALLCDDPHLDTPGVRLGVAAYDFPVVRLECGNARTFNKLTGRKSTQLGKIVEQLASIDRVIVRTEFMRGEVDNSTDSEVKGWIKRLQDVRPTEIQIWSANPRGSAKDGSRGIPKSRLQQIVDEVTEKVGSTVVLLDAAEVQALTA